MGVYSIYLLYMKRDTVVVYSRPAQVIRTTADQGGADNNAL